MTHSNERPARIEQLGMSTFAYNYDVQEVSVQDNGNERTEFQFKTLVFDHKPTKNEVINRIITERYPDGEESAIQRKGILDSQNPEFVDYNEFVEGVKIKVAQEYEEIQ